MYIVLLPEPLPEIPTWPNICRTRMDSLRHLHYNNVVFHPPLVPSPTPFHPPILSTYTMFLINNDNHFLFTIFSALSSSDLIRFTAKSKRTPHPLNRSLAGWQSNIYIFILVLILIHFRLWCTRIDPCCAPSHCNRNVRSCFPNEQH